MNLDKAKKMNRILKQRNKKILFQMKVARNKLNQKDQQLKKFIVRCDELFTESRNKVNKVDKKLKQLQKYVSTHCPTDCIICKNELANIALVPCGHICLGLNCFELCLNNNDQCPICKTTVEYVQRVYFS